MKNILEIKNLYVSYQTFGGIAQAVNNLNLSIKPGESLGLVGETGAGKTTTALSILKLLPPRTGRIDEGEIYFDGVDLIKKTRRIHAKNKGEQDFYDFPKPLNISKPCFYHRRAN